MPLITWRSLLLLSTVPSAHAHAQQAAVSVPQFASAASGASVSEDIVVTGARLQAVREIEAQQQISVISDSISADEIGKLPDFGLGEALQPMLGGIDIQGSQAR